MIVSEHKQLLMPKTKTKALLDDVVSLAGFCDEESCKELIFITGELTTTSKKMKHDKSLRTRPIDGKGLISTGAINKLEAFVDKLKHSQLINDKRAGSQYLAAQKLEKKQGRIKLTTSTGPVPQMPVPPPPCSGSNVGGGGVEAVAVHVRDGESARCVGLVHPQGDTCM